MARKITQSEYIDRKRKTGQLEYVLDNGRTFYVDPALVWNDQRKALFRKARELGERSADSKLSFEERSKLEDEGNQLMAEAMLGGRSEVEQFLEGGGILDVLFTAFGEEHGDPGES